MSSRNPGPRLGSGLIARKGEAAPTVTSAQIEAQPEPEIKALPVARGLTGTIAVTLRLDPDRYERLKVHGAKSRRTNQDILVEALDAYFSQQNNLLT